MKKSTLLFAMMLAMFATSAQAACDLTDGGWYYIKSVFHNTYINFSSLPQESSTQEALKVVKQTSGKWQITNASGKFLSYSTWNAAASTSPFNWTIEGSASEGYYISSESGEMTYPGYFGPQVDKTKFYTNNSDKTNCKFTFTPVGGNYVTITYQIVDPTSGEALFSQDVQAEVGKPYPTPTAPNAWIILSGVPEGNVTKEETVDLTYTSRYTCFASASEITQWYALDIHGNEGDYPVYTTIGCDTLWAYNNTNTAYSKRRVAEGTADDYQNGAVMNDNFAWGFVGDPFAGVKIYNKGREKFVYFDGVPTGVSDRTKAPAWVNADEEDASVFQIVATTASVENAFSFQNNNASTAKNILNQKNYVVSGYNAADGGSAMRAWAINTVTAQQERTFTDEYGTIILPFYSEIPVGVTVYSCAAYDRVTLTLTEEKAIYPNVPYIIKGTAGDAYNFSNTSAGTYTEPATKGLLTGVFSSTTAPVASYVLQKNNDVLGFYQVAASQELTIDGNHCYLTLPEPTDKALFFDEETGINEVEENDNENENGKFLKNGKIVIVKGNKKYNVAGQMMK